MLAAAAIPLTTALLWAGLTWSAVLLLLGVRRLVRIPIGDLSTPFVYAGIGALIVVVVAGAAFLVAERRCRHLAETGQGLGPAGTAVATSVRFLGMVQVHPWFGAGLRSRARVVRDDGELAAAGCLSVLFLPPMLLSGIEAEGDRRARLRAMDVDRAAEVLALAYAEGRRVAHEAVGRRLPHVDVAAALHDLSLIDGVVFLQGPPAGLTIGERLRAELDAACHAPA